MAKTLQTQIIFAGVDRVSKVIKQIQGNVGKLGANLNGVTKGFQTAGQGMQSAALGAAPISFAAGYAMKDVLGTTIELERKLTEIGALSGEAFDSKPIQDLKREIFQVADLTPFKPAEVADVADELKRAGNNLDFINKNLQPLMEGASMVKGDMGAGAYADAVTNILAGANLESTTENLEYVNDLLGKAAMETNSKVNTLSESFRTAAPVASAFGMELETMGGFLMTLSKGGFKGSNEGAKALRTIMLRTVAPTKKAQQVLAAHNIELAKYQTGVKKAIDAGGVDAALDAAGFSAVGDNIDQQVATILNNSTLAAEERIDQAIQTLRDAGQEFTQESEAALRDALSTEMVRGQGFDFEAYFKDLEALREAGKLTTAQMEALAGKERYAQFAYLTSNTAATAENTRILKEEAEGATKAYNELAGTSLSRRLDRLAGRFEAFKNILGDSSSDAFGKSIDFVSDRLSDLNGYLQKNETLAGAMMVTMAGFSALAPTLATLGLAAQGLGVLSKPFVALARLPFQATAAGLGLIRAALMAFNSGLKGIFSLTRLVALFSGVGIAAVAAGALIKATWSDWDGITERFSKHLPDAMADMGDAWNKLMQGDHSGAWKSFTDGLDHMKDGFKEAFGPVIGRAIATARETLTNWFDSFPGFEHSLDALGQAFRGIWDTLTGLDFSGSGDGIVGVFQKIGDAVLKVQTWAIDQITAAITNLDDILKKFVEGYNQGGLMAGLGAAFDEISNKVRNLWAGSEEGTAAFDALWLSMDNVRTAAQNLWDSLPSFTLSVDAPEGEQTALQKFGQSIKDAISETQIALMEGFAAALNAIAAGMDNVRIAAGKFGEGKWGEGFDQMFGGLRSIDTGAFAAFAVAIGMLAKKWTFPALRALPGLISKIGPFKLFALAYAIGELTESLTGLDGMDLVNIGFGLWGLKKAYNYIRKITGAGDKAGKSVGKLRGKTSVATNSARTLKSVWSGISKTIKGASKGADDLAKKTKAPPKLKPKATGTVPPRMQKLHQQGPTQGLKSVAPRPITPAQPVAPAAPVAPTPAPVAQAPAAPSKVVNAVKDVASKVKPKDLLKGAGKGGIAALVTVVGEIAADAGTKYVGEKLQGIDYDKMPKEDYSIGGNINRLAGEISKGWNWLIGNNQEAAPKPPATPAIDTPKVEAPAIKAMNDNLPAMPEAPKMAVGANSWPDIPEWAEPASLAPLEDSGNAAIVSRLDALATAQLQTNARLDSIDGSSRQTATNTGRTADSVSGLGATIAANLRGIMNRNPASNAPGSPQRAVVSSNGQSGPHL